MDIIDLIDLAGKEAEAFTNHPAKNLSLEERLLYLNGLALVMNADGQIHVEEKEYIRILIKSMDMDQSCLNDMVAFAQAPDKDTIQAFFKAFRRKPLTQLFLFDAYMIAMRDGVLNEKETIAIDKLAGYLEILKGTKQDVFDLFCYIRNKDWQESGLYFDSHLLNPEYFRHLLDYYEVDFDDLMNSTREVLEQRLRERYGLRLEWIPLKYDNSAESSEAKEVTKDFVNLEVTCGMLVPYLQHLLDRGKIRVSQTSVYAGELYLFDLNNISASFDYRCKTFFIEPGCEDESFLDVSEFIITGLMSKLGISVETIAKGQRIKRNSFSLSLPIGGAFVQSGTLSHSEYDLSIISFPCGEDDRGLKEEIVIGHDGRLFENVDGGITAPIDQTLVQGAGLSTLLKLGKFRLIR